MNNRLSWLAGPALVLAAAAAQAGTVAGVEAVTSAAIKTTVADEAAEPMALPVAPSVASNYAFTTTTTGSLADMSSGTTQLLAANVDDAASTLTGIGFEFVFQGARYTQFSVNDNGVLRLGAPAQAGSPHQPLAQAGLPIITAYGADQRTHLGDGKVHYRVGGSAPSRTLIVEWLNTQSNFNAGGTADLTYQVQLHESTGVIDFVYGRMSLSAAGASDVDSNDPQIGFSSSNVAGAVGSVAAPQAGEPAFDGASATATNNLYTAGAITVLTSAANGSRRTMTFTPPPVTASPADLTFSSIGPGSMTLNWTDSGNELSYAIYRSSDGVNYTAFGTALQNATSFDATGLQAVTNYFWQVVAIGEGTASVPLTGVQATVAAGSVSSTAVGGNWSSPLTWAGGAVPTPNDAVTIGAGATVVIDTAAVAYSVSIANGAVLRWDSATARTLVVDGPIVNAGVFDTPATGAVATHMLTAGADLINDGTLDFSTNANAAAAGITFVGRENNRFGGSGATTDVRTLTINKSTGTTSVLVLDAANFTVQGVATDVAAFVTLINGTFKLSGSFPLTSRLFAPAGYIVPASAGFWLDNPNATVVAQNGSPTVNGRLRISQGTYNVGTASGNSLGFGAGSAITIDGGAVNTAGRFGVSLGGNLISYTQSGGTITVNTAGNASSTLASYDLGQNTSSTIAISGGTVVVQLANTSGTPRDYRNQAGAGPASVTGGTVQFGNAASGAAKAFTAVGVLPDVVVDTASGNHSVAMLLPAVYNNLTRNLTIKAGGTFSTGTSAFLFYGDTITNDGTLNSSGSGTQFILFRPATNVRYQGSGTVTAPMVSLSLQNDLDFTIDPAASGIIANRVNFFSGRFVNANKLTLRGGSLGPATVQIGGVTTPTAGGSFDVTPNFDFSTGTQSVLYLRTTAPWTTGTEINPLRTVEGLRYDDDDATHALTIGGGDLTVRTTLSLTNGRIVTGASRLGLIAAATTARTAGYVDGNLVKVLNTAASKTLELGTANGYSPVVVNVTAAAFPVTLEGTAVQAVMPNFAPADKAIARHWRIGASAGTTADLTFGYLDTDVPIGVTEADLHLYDGTPNPPTVFSDLGGTLDTTLNTGTIAGIAAFGSFTLAEAGGGTAADLRISKTDGATQVETGETATYTITVTNPGTVAVAAATVDDVPGADLACGDWTCAAAGGAGCGAASGTGVLSDVPSLPAGATVIYTQQCAVAAASAASSVGNSATVALPAGFIDPTPADNSATDTDALVRLVDAVITKTDGGTTAYPGAAVTYTIVATNGGPNTATTTVSDTFPAALTGCSWTCAAGSGSCGAAGGSGDIVDTGSIESGGTLTYTASCTVSPDAAGTLTNVASIAVGNGERDTDAANDTATDVDTIAPLPDVAVSISDDREFVRIGDSLDYVITVTNAKSPLSASAVVDDVLPDGLGNGSWTCVPSGGATCASGSGNTLHDAATLPAGSQVSYVYSATVLPGSLDGRIANTVTATVAGDPDTANNTATDDDVIVLFEDGFENAPAMFVPADAGSANGYVTGRLRVDPQLLSGLGLKPVAVVGGVDGRGAGLFALELARFDGQVMLRSVLRDANGLAERSAWFAVDPTRNAIEFAWQAAGADAADGYLRLAGGAASQLSGERPERASLAGLRPLRQQGLAWVSLIGGN
ncbi:beta strand repeat-containing protein [Tahibacter caeni]|uniref:beta strand repeat-containing protein n=1 Tax=Tahibacter caeni TaxID=1453545 RepID=UPI00214759B2|nr:hypothetical protein [Tahibacter caeni]